MFLPERLLPAVTSCPPIVGPPSPVTPPDAALLAADTPSRDTFVIACLTLGMYLICLPAYLTPSPSQNGSSMRTGGLGCLALPLILQAQEVHGTYLLVAK